MAPAHKFGVVEVVGCAMHTLSDDLTPSSRRSISGAVSPTRYSPFHWNRCARHTLRRAPNGHHFALATSTAKTCEGPNMFAWKTIHLPSGVNWQFGSSA